MISAKKKKRKQNTDLCSIEANKEKVCLKPPYVGTSCKRLKTQFFLSALTVQLPGLCFGQALGTKERLWAIFWVISDSGCTSLEVFLQ